MSLIETHLCTGLGAAMSVFLTGMGAAMASVEGGAYAMRRTGSGYKAFIPVVQAGVLAIYGIIVPVVMINKLDSSDGQSAGQGYRNLCAGLSVGLSCLASGYGMAGFLKYINAQAPATSSYSSPAATESAPSESDPLLPGRSGGSSSLDKEYAKSLIMVLIFLESIGLYGLIVALFLIGK